MLTLAAWALLAFWMRGALLLVYDWLSAPLFEFSSERPPDWPGIWRTLSPFLALAALLAAWLFYWAMRRRGILAQGRDIAQPPALGLEAHARRFGLSLADVEAWRSAQVVTVHFDGSGTDPLSPSK